MNKTRIVHIKKEKWDVRIDRASIYGNPFTHIKDKKTKAMIVVPTREDAIDYCRRWLNEGAPFLISIGIKEGDPLFALLMEKRKLILESLHLLKGKTLACWCKPKSCHGDVYVELLEKMIEEKP